jgi:3-phosphoshikimate 1-carboxyvinyltransferase
MTIRITRPIQGGATNAIASKSQAHRLLICAALSSRETRVICSETNDDIDATARCLNALGARVIYESGVFCVSPIKRPVQGKKNLDVGESGSTLRFMLPVACALGADAVFIMGGRLPARPLTPLYEELNAHGCALSPKGMNPLHVSGQLRNGRYALPGNISSQFVSGLLLALPLLNGDSFIKVTGELESEPYVDMTVAALKKYGIEIKKEHRGYIVKGGQHFAPQETVSVEGDWSNAAFWLCAGAFGPNAVTVTKLNPGSLQGDKSVLRALECFGARVECGHDSATVQRNFLKGTNIDASDIPDLVPVLAAVASVSDGTTTIYNAGRLRMKESDRLKTVSETLRSLGADITETQDGLVIHGKKQLAGGIADSHNDHRIAMMAAIISSACKDPVVIRGAETVNKSYPGFFSDFAALGGIAEEVK